MKFQNLLNKIEKHRLSEKLLWKFFVNFKDFFWGIKYSFKIVVKYYFTQARPKKSPNFIILGAMKSGTTTLYNSLKQHPDIFMSNIKEPGLFLDSHQKIDYPSSASFNADMRNHLINYQVRAFMFQGYNNEKMVGEASTAYTKFPFHGTDIPKRMHSYSSDMKFIYILRNPVDRIISQYLHVLEYYPAEDVKQGGNYVLQKNYDAFLNLSLYYFQLSNFLKYFSKQNFKIIIFEEFISNPSQTLKTIYDFLGVDSSVDFDLPLKIHNQSKFVKDSFDSGDKLSGENYDYLIKPIREDVEKLENFLGRELTIWDLSKDKWCETQQETLK